MKMVIVQDSIWNNMEVKVHLSSDTLVFYVPTPDGELVLYNYDTNRFSKLLSKTELESEASLLSVRFTKVTGEEKELKYFEGIITSVIEKCLFSKMDQVKIDNERLKSFLVYHIKTLRSIGKYYNSSMEDGMKYVSDELYNVTNMTIDDLFKILDSITKKRNEKK